MIKVDEWHDKLFIHIVKGMKMSGCHVPPSETSQSLAEVLHELKLTMIEVERRLSKLEDDKHIKKIHCSFCGKTSLVKL